MLQLSENIIELESVDSTNNYLSKLISTTNVPNGTVILTQNQTKGRGQRENTWHTAPGKNITLSIYLTFNKLAIEDNFLISMMTANSVLKFINQHIEHAQIKWPNDILIHQKKTGGILIENTIKGNCVKHSIIGIGLNINQEKFEGLQNATSLALEAGTSFNLNTIIKELLNHLSFHYMQLITGKHHAIKQYYFHNLYGFKKVFQFKVVNTDAILTGHIIDVKNNGVLHVETSSQKYTFHFKEIEFIL